MRNRIRYIFPKRNWSIPFKSKNQISQAKDSWDLGSSNQNRMFGQGAALKYGIVLATVTEIDFLIPETCNWIKFIWTNWIESQQRQLNFEKNSIDQHVYWSGLSFSRLFKTWKWSAARTKNQQLTDLFSFLSSLALISKENKLWIQLKLTESEGIF